MTEIDLGELRVVIAKPDERTQGLHARGLGLAVFAQRVLEAGDVAHLAVRHEAAVDDLAGHVGADTAGVLLAETPWARAEYSLLIDVGTNAEIVLGNQDRLLAASSPTGPAFEGAQISSGQRAAPGAIERVRIDPDTLEPRYRVIGIEAWSDEDGFDEALGATGVTGLCGSGIIEAVAEMRIAGLLDPSGLIGEGITVGVGRITDDGVSFAAILRVRVRYADGQEELAVRVAPIEDVTPFGRLEIAFLFPWAVVLDQIGMVGFWAMMIFLGVLVVGFIYEWKKGALEWE